MPLREIASHCIVAIDSDGQKPDRKGGRDLSCSDQEGVHSYVSQYQNSAQLQTTGY
jgi:hypothetical protein